MRKSDLKCEHKCCGHQKDIDGSIENIVHLIRVPEITHDLTEMFHIPSSVGYGTEN